MKHALELAGRYGATLHAPQLATAVRAAVDAVLTCERRLAGAVRRHGLDVLSPAS